MKIKNKIIVLFSIIILTIVVVGILTTGYVSDHFIHYKYDKAYDYYYQQDLSPSEFSDYLINEGFIVTSQQIPEYAGTGDISCHIEEDELVVYENDQPVLYAILNENIVNDMNNLLIYSFIFTNVLIIIILIIIYFYFNKSILYKLNNLETMMVNFKEVDHFEASDEETNNEIDKLVFEFYKMANTIKFENKQKKFLIMTLSHELKNPISNIEAIIDMNRLGIEPYNANCTQNDLMEPQVEKMKSIVAELVNAYKYEIDQPFEQVEVKPLIEEVINSQLLPSSTINFKFNESADHTIKTNPKIFEHIISNIISNIHKYSQAASDAQITITDSSIEFINVRSDKEKVDSTEVGQLINQYFGHEIGIEITNSSTAENYHTSIKY